eukprot:CAMPEP_0182425898 /NCGR_PEP_ID=MMETSP1167-20130531/12393_1 /TAXON_ID=2988 /ORGANISM="Mallomonas Sp, Strain CCMP3275" /LENGTH=33 /DNA_ID= /DNA_START= /DNA_END= /DNA_ORIENTATION=
MMALQMEISKEREMVFVMGNVTGLPKVQLSVIP